DSGDDAVRPDPADAVVKRICDIKATVRRHGYAPGAGEHCLGGRAAVAAEAHRALSGDSGDDAVRPDPANAGGKSLDDVKAAVRRHGHTHGNRNSSGNGGDNLANRLCAAACTIPQKEHCASRVISVMRAEAPSAHLGGESAEKVLALLPNRDLLTCTIR